jgi:hypothetical protein
MPIVQVPQILLPQTNYEQLRNGTRGVVFKLSSQLVGKVLFGTEGENYWLRDDHEAIEELEYENNINEILFENNIGNVPKPIGIEKLGLFNGTYPVYIMEYIRGLPHGDEIINPTDQFVAKQLIDAEVYKATDLDIFPGKDYDNSWNYFYDKNRELVRLIDFGRWTTGETLKSPYA